MLGRGVTLEGLTVSYYVRSSAMETADISMQACRWFGHRTAETRDLVTVHVQVQYALFASALLALSPQTIAYM